MSSHFTDKVTISQAHVRSVSLISGTNGSVVCHFNGHPIQIQWSKQGLDRLPDDRMLPSNNMLRIRLVRKEDAGKYFCSAFDGVSTITATVNVTVKGMQLIFLTTVRLQCVCKTGISIFIGRYIASVPAFLFVFVFAFLFSLCFGIRFSFSLRAPLFTVF